MELHSAEPSLKKQSNFGAINIEGSAIKKKRI